MNEFVRSDQFQKIDHIAPTRAAERLFSISKTDVAELKAETEAAKGRVKVFVHPYFELHNPEEMSSYHQNPKSNKSSIRQVRRIDKFIGSSNRNMPVVIFEERKNLEKTRSTLAKMFPDAKVYFIPTIGGSGIPDLDFQIAGSPEGFWEIIARALKDVGTEKLYVGGTRLSKFNTKCVNNVIRGLEPYFVTEVSSFAHPHTRKDFHTKPLRKG